MTLVKQRSLAAWISLLHCCNASNVCTIDLRASSFNAIMIRSALFGPCLSYQSRKAAPLSYQSRKAAPRYRVHYPLPGRNGGNTRAGGEAVPGLATSLVSDRHAVSIKLVVIIVTALARPKVGVVVHELDCGDPLHHPEAQLVLAAQAQRRAVHDTKRLIVHLVGEQGQLVPQVAHRVDLIVAPAVVAEGH